MTLSNSGCPECVVCSVQHPDSKPSLYAASRAKTELAKKGEGRTFACHLYMEWFTEKAFIALVAGLPAILTALTALIVAVRGNKKANEVNAKIETLEKENAANAAVLERLRKS